MVASGTLQVWSNWGVNSISEERGERLRKAMPETEALLANHDLASLLDLALEQSLRFASEQKGFLLHAEVLQKLAGQVKGSHGRLVELVLADKNGLERVLGEAVDEDLGVQEEEWALVIRDLAAHVGCDVPDALLRRLLPLLAEKVPIMVGEILKEDSQGRGPLEGRAYAALWLHARVQILKDLKELKESTKASADSLHKALGTLEELLLKRIDQAVGAVGGGLSKLDGRLKDWLEQSDERVASAFAGLDARLEKLETLGEALVDRLGSSGLMRRESFTHATWARFGQKTELGPLMDDAERAELLQSRIVGRDDELRAFDKFLADPSLQVQYWKAWPGTGKSRLVLAMAELAELRGWLPLFVEDRTKNILAGLTSEVKTSEAQHALSIVLIWDTSSGGFNLDFVEELLALSRRHGVLERGLNIKVAITSWPTHRTAIAARHGSESWFDERELEDISNEAEFVRFIGELLTQEHPPEAPQQLFKASDGNPLVALTGVGELLSGKDIAELKSADKILHSRYNTLIVDVLRPYQGKAPARLAKAIRAMAMIGQFQLTDKLARDCLGKAGIDVNEDVVALAEAGFLSRPDGGFLMSPDRFRVAIAKMSHDSEGPLSLVDRTKEWTEECLPLAPRWLDDTWAITAQALGQESFGELADELLAGVSSTVWDEGQA